MAEYRVFLRTTTQAINAEFDKYSADKLNIRYFNNIGRNLFDVKIRTNENAKFKDFETYTLAEAIRIDKAGLKKGVLEHYKKERNE
ncbi:MAG: hypothetical protein MSS71_07100 [Campylobacter sp.]|uniref:hypothetical protein n=1 Tax=Campylobacter sp. TaxID=205 RepID=UPI002AA6935A|nr:hypothetical protein [Campylobacter sp.]MCI7587601.1 hypothetical protein [Campylobacter sp.]